MKKYYVLVFAFVLVFTLLCSSCSSVPATDGNTGSAATDGNTGFVPVDDDCRTIYTMEKLNGYYSSNFSYYRDTVTDVMYLWCKGGYAGGLTVMLDPSSGLPLTYSRYIEMAG